MGKTYSVYINGYIKYKGLSYESAVQTQQEYYMSGNTGTARVIED